MVPALEGYGEEKRMSELASKSQQRHALSQSAQAQLQPTGWPVKKERKLEGDLGFGFPGFR